MGQYYTPVLGTGSGESFAPRAYAYSHEFGNGLKLMEHSWVGNGFVGRIEQELLHNPQRVVWAGDYADVEPNGSLLYDAEGMGAKRLKPDGEATRAEVRFVLNHERKEYVDFLDLPGMGVLGEKDTWVIHPLPLLTAEGNGRGGGDYHGRGMQYVGRWSRELVSVETGDWVPPTDWVNLKPDFLETR